MSLCKRWQFPATFIFLASNMEHGHAFYTSRQSHAKEGGSFQGSKSDYMNECVFVAESRTT